MPTVGTLFVKLGTCVLVPSVLSELGVTVVLPEVAGVGVKAPGTGPVVVPVVEVRPRPPEAAVPVPAPTFAALPAPAPTPPAAPYPAAPAPWI